jgi:hypothetical protein
MPEQNNYLDYIQDKYIENNSISFNGYAKETKLVCCTKKAVGNLFLQFKFMLQNLINDQYLDFKNYEAGFFHSFLVMLNYLYDKSNLKDTNDLTPNNFYRLEMNNRSNKFIFPKIITVKEKNNLILKYDHVTQKNSTHVSFSKLFWSLKNRDPYQPTFTAWYSYDNVCLDNVFANTFACTRKHVHSDGECLSDVETKIKFAVDKQKKFNNTEEGSLLFDKVINLIQIFQNNDFVNIAILYFEILQDSKKKIYNLEGIKLTTNSHLKRNQFTRISILEISLFILLGINSNTSLETFYELLECHLAPTETHSETMNISTQDVRPKKRTKTTMDPTRMKTITEKIELV